MFIHYFTDFQNQQSTCFIQYLLDIVCKYLIDNITSANPNHRFVVTGADDVPIQVIKGKKHQRLDLKTSHEEADCIIVQ